MGRISEYRSWTLDLRKGFWMTRTLEKILESLCQLGISVRRRASVLHEVNNFLRLQSCILCHKVLKIKSKPISGLAERILDDEVLGDDSVAEVQTLQKEQGGNDVWRFSGSFFPKSKPIISSFHLLLSVFLIFAMFMDVHGDLLEFPENYAVRANKVAIMKCKTNSTTKPIIWAATDQASNKLSIFDGDKVNPTYEEFVTVTPSAGRYDLRVKATSQMALMYKCIAPGAENIERTAELIVIESDPTCVVTPNVPNNDADTEFIDLVCNMSLSGNWIPSLTWRVNGIQGPLAALNHTQRLGVQRVIVTSTLKNVSRDDKHMYLCEAYFSLESRTVVSATNVPGYKYTCTARDIQPTLSTTLQPVPVSKPSIICACLYVWRKEFIAFLILFLIVTVVLIGLIVYLYMNNWTLAFLESQKRRSGSSNGGKPKLAGTGETELVEL